MSTKRFTEEFKIEAVGQVVHKGHPVAEVAARLGVSQHSLYQWIKQHKVPVAERLAQATQSDEVRRLKAELKRVTEERDILKNGHRGAVPSQWTETPRYLLLRSANPANGVREPC